MRFPYTTFAPRDRLRRLVRVYLRNQFSTFSALGLLDSGSDISIFSADVASVLQIPLPTGDVWHFRGTTGQVQIGHVARVEIGVSAPSGELAFRFDSEVAFCPDLRFQGIGLLGQQGFFSRFRITFENARGFFELEKT